MAAPLSREELLTLYFRLGYSNSEIRAVLVAEHNITISDRHIKRLLSKLGLYRRKHQSDENSVAAFIQEQLLTSGRLHGYRWMHLKCCQAGFNVSKERVRILLSALDPDGVRLRSRRGIVRRLYHSKGPNFVWHVDGYDKVKHYGIAISGCIDGFSRNIIWLEASYTNNDPAIIGGYFMKAVELYGGCPSVVRTDLGTENVGIEHLQTFLHRNQPHSPFIYGKSTRNQRIEAWWNVLRKHCTQYWMQLFYSLQEEGDFCGDQLDRELIRFCFLNLIQGELDRLALEWNHHRIRGSHPVGGNTVFGRPAIMFGAPELYGVDDCLWKVPEEEINACLEECRFKGDLPCDEDLHELCRLIMDEHSWRSPKNGEDGQDLYRFLRMAIRAELVM